MTSRPVIVLLLFVGGLVGCAMGPGRKKLNRPPEPVASVDRITILSLPAAINLDNVPGADGLRVKVYLFQLAQPKPVIAAGTLEFLLYENKINRSDLHTKRPLKVWSFPAEKLRMYLVPSMVGWCYAMELRWGVEAPKADSISLAARYDSPNGRTIYSTPVVIAMGQK